jgi:mevalonate kinase
MKMPESSTYFSNGNLLITGEYFVLTGATAFAVPLKYGQEMRIETGGNYQGRINWRVYELSRPWLSVDLDSGKLNINGSSSTDKALRLQKVLRAIKRQKPGLFGKERSYNIRCNVGFNLEWGWGSSSSLICNLASWAGIDPFQLNKLVSSGSGYDIAASASDSPVYFSINYGRHTITKGKFNPPFKKSVYFIYTGRKQNTQESIKRNLESVKKSSFSISSMISWLTEKITTENDVNEFMRYMAEHEKILSKTLGMPGIREKYFRDFEGEVKSLGAWGGDFIMAVYPGGEERLRNYFNIRGLNTIFRFEDIVKEGLQEFSPEGNT